MLPITINGHRTKLPTRWEDITIERMQAIVKGQEDTVKWSDVRHRLAAYTGEPFEVFESVTSSPDALEVVMNCLQFEENSVMDFIKVDPGVIHFYGEDGLATQTIRVPRDLGGVPSGCMVAFREKVLKPLTDGEELVNLLHVAIAAIMHPVYTGRGFDFDAMEKVADDALRCKFVEAWGVVGFFLRKQNVYPGWRESFSSPHTSQQETNNTARSSSSTGG